MISVDEKINLCSRVLMVWFLKEKEEDVSVHEKEVADMFISQILMKKLAAVGVDVVIPDPLLVMIDLCCNSNPGISQLMLKDILLSIKNRKGPVPKGYVITTDDFSLCYPNRFPVIEYPDINKKFEEMWDSQKIFIGGKERNSCDTAEWWLEVME